MTVAAAPAGYANVRDWIDSSFDALHTEAAGQTATASLTTPMIIGVLLVDNGIAAVTFLATGGVPLIVELGVSADLVLAVLVLQLLTTRLHAAFGTADLDDLRELHD